MTARGLSRVCGALAVVLLALSGPPAAAGRPFEPQDASAGSVVGVVWRHDDSPLPNASVRLRNVVTGRIAATATADSIGRVRFVVERGTYVLELTSSGRVEAIGYVFDVTPGETVATFVRLPAPSRRLAGFFSNAAASVMLSAAAAGITAVGAGLQPLSPTR